MKRQLTRRAVYASALGIASALVACASPTAPRFDHTELVRKPVISDSGFVPAPYPPRPRVP